MILFCDVWPVAMFFKCNLPRQNFFIVIGRVGSGGLRSLHSRINKYLNGVENEEYEDYEDYEEYEEYEEMKKIVDTVRELKKIKLCKTSDGRTYKSGESFPCPDGCNVCRCSCRSLTHSFNSLMGWNGLDHFFLTLFTSVHADAASVQPKWDAK